MEVFWIVAYSILAGLAIVQSLLFTLQTWEHRRYARSCMRGLKRHRCTDRVAVFAPCKGLDVDLEGNLCALLEQDYEDYEVTFVVESPDDPAAEVIRRVIAAHPSVPARLVIAGRAIDSGQKVHNLRAATADLSPEVDHLAFIDSDARPRPEWLRSMATRLSECHQGAVTGYRWFTPVRRSLAHHLICGINCDVMSLFGKNNHYLLWGGSWGIKRSVFDAIGLREAWHGTLSDDLVASRQLRRGRVRVRFEPACVVTSPLDYSWQQMFMFIRRQYLMGRFYTIDWWLFGLVSGACANLTWAANAAALVCGLTYGTPPAWIPIATCGLLYLLSVFRGRLRQNLAGVYFPDRQAALRATLRWDVWAAPIVGCVHWFGMLGSLFGREIRWRGITYRVLSDGKIRLIRREEEPPATPPSDGRPDRSKPSRTEKQLVPYGKAG